MSSPPRSELLDLERDIPTTAVDIAALARLRSLRRADLLRDLDRLPASPWPGWPRAPRVPRGWEPFEL